MNFLSVFTALSVLAACSEYDPPLPIESVSYKFQCTMDKGTIPTVGKLVAIEPFSFEATLVNEGKFAIFQRDGKTFRGRYSGQSGNRNQGNNIYNGRHLGEIVIISLPRFAKPGGITYSEFERRRISATYTGACR